MNSKFVKVLISVCVMLVGMFIIAEAVFAAPGSKYYHNKSGCLAASGGRGGFGAVQYACGVASCDDAVDKASCEAAPGGQQGCALWLGSTTNSRSTTIYVEQDTGTVNVAFWGMCTDRTDKTSKIEVTNDGDAINDSGSLLRQGWNHPSSTTTTLDIDKFKLVATKTVISDCETKYSKIIDVERWHSDGVTHNKMSQEVILIVRQNADECTPVTPPPETDLCDSWAPQSYLNSGDRNGTTSVDIRIKNTSMANDSSRSASPYADWETNRSDRLIYAMPTDVIEWYTCYFPGVQATADTEVSSVNGRPPYYIDGSWGNYNELRDDVCQAEGVTYKPLKEAPSLEHPWENAYSLGQASGSEVKGRAEWGDLVGWNGGAPTFGNTDIHYSESGRNTREGDAGDVYGERADTGPSSNLNAPIIAKIKSYNPTCEVYNDTCGECPCSSGEDGCVCDSEGKNCKKACWGKCACNSGYSSQLENAEVTYGPDTGQDKVAIPYNFDNSTSVTLSGSEVFSGETVTVDTVTVTVGEKGNSETRATYATEVPKAKAALYGYVSRSSNGGGRPADSSSVPNCNSGTTTFPGAVSEKQCAAFQQITEIVGGLNKHGVLHSPPTEYLDGSDGNPDFTRTYDAFDATAGDFICFVSAVWPAASNGDTDMVGSNDTWRYSDPACKVVAKRPSFQVWGSDMYSNSTINNRPALKRNIYNGYANMGDTFSEKDGGWDIYSSWVEEGLLLGGSATTENLASGAGTGKTSNASKANAGNSGDFCNYGTALTFSNVSGASGCANSYGMNLYPDDSEREVLIDYWTGGSTKPGADSEVGTDIDLSDVASKGASIPSGSGATIRYIEPTGDLSIHGTIGRHTTVLIKSNNLVTITGDVVYENSYSSGDTLREIPKLVIYASNVDIQCGVGEVDAIIITKEGGTVNTCAEHPDIPDPADHITTSARSKQLKIFGVVIADNIVLGRTYGAAAWDGSGDNGQQQAAEVFDFDSSILLWSEFMASSSETDTLQQVYQVEIAPRY